MFFVGSLVLLSCGSKSVDENYDGSANETVANNVADNELAEDFLVETDMTAEFIETNAVLSKPGTDVATSPVSATESVDGLATSVVADAEDITGQ
jgi:hypothetical protein